MPFSKLFGTACSCCGVERQANGSRGWRLIGSIRLSARDGATRLRLSSSHHLPRCQTSVLFLSSHFVLTVIEWLSWMAVVPRNVLDVRRLKSWFVWLSNDDSSQDDGQRVVKGTLTIKFKGDFPDPERAERKLLTISTATEITDDCN